MKINEEIILSIEDMEKATNGYWVNIDKTIKISSVGMLPNSIQDGSLAIAADSSKWKNISNNTHNNINQMIKKGAIAVMVDKSWYDNNSENNYKIPLLIVENTFKALHSLAIE